MIADSGSGELTLFPSAARTATVSSGDASSVGGAFGSSAPPLWRAQGIHIVIDVTAIGSAPSVTPRVDGYDALSGKYYTLLTGVAITATGTTVLKIRPGITPVANASANDAVPAVVRVTMTHANSDSMTYSVSVHLLP